MEAIAVFGQLAHILRERSLSVADLKRQIEERFELAVEESALEHLAGAQRIGQIDLTMVGAAAQILGVTLDDLLFVLALPFSPMHPTTKVNMLTEEETWRVWALFGMQEKRTLSDLEQHELQAISEEGERRWREVLWRKEAERRGISFEDLREEIEADERAIAAMKEPAWSYEELYPDDAAERAEQHRATASR